MKAAREQTMTLLRSQVEGALALADTRPGHVTIIEGAEWLVISGRNSRGGGVADPMCPRRAWRLGWRLLGAAIRLRIKRWAFDAEADRR